MRFRNSRLRTKIVALLLSLVALWLFAAWVTLREGVNLLWVSTVNDGVAQPIDKLQPELQMERRLTLIMLAAPDAQNRADVEAQRAKTDRAISVFERKARSGAVKQAESPELKQAIDLGYSRYNALPGARAAIDAGRLDRTKAAAVYSDAIDAIFQMDDSLATLDDKNFAKDVQTLVWLNRSREVLSQEDALVSGILASRRFSSADYLEFVQIVGAERVTIGNAMEKLQGADMTSYNLVVKNGSLDRLRAFEDQLMTKVKAERTAPVTAEQWRAVADPALSALSDAVFGGGDRMVKRAQPIAMGVVLRLLLAGGLGLIAVIASIVLAITTTKTILRQLENLRNAAKELADKRLPSVVERLGHGEQVDVSAEAPPLMFGDDAIGQVGQAFNAVQETAIRTAVEQAELRRGIRDILLSLARRSQALVHRQLTLLDTMERREQDTKELEDLFRVDHLATRMRRNAENLIVLSGATPARGWRKPVPMVDVIRSAVAEVEDYTRVRVSPIGEVALTGRAVGDISHLLAELIENAVSFSPPYTEAVISGHMAATGYAIEIEDRGLGMTDEALAGINERISNPPEFNLSASVQLGLYVVGRLAERYGVRVSLKHSPYGGTTAVVLIPRDLIVEGQDGEAQDEPVKVGAVVEAREAQSALEPTRVEPLRVVEAPPPPQEETASADQAEPAPEPVQAEERTGEFLTPAGLPFRVPQASLAPALRGEPEPETAAVEDDSMRSPEEIRKIVGAFQSGTKRGRSEAARAQGQEDDDQ